LKEKKNEKYCKNIFAEKMETKIILFRNIKRIKEEKKSWGF